MQTHKVGKMRLDKLNSKEELWLSQMTKTALPEVNSMVLKLNAMLVKHASMVKNSTD
jgi:hypothetical protein